MRYVGRGSLLFAVLYLLPNIMNGIGHVTLSYQETTSYVNSITLSGNIHTITDSTFALLLCFVHMCHLAGSSLYLIPTWGRVASCAKQKVWVQANCLPLARQILTMQVSLEGSQINLLTCLRLFSLSSFIQLVLCLPA